MAEWFGAVPAFLVASAWLLAPGCAVLWLVGARGLLLAASAPAASVLIAGCSAIVLGWLGIGWSPVSVLAIVAILTLVAWGTRTLVMRRRGLTIPAPLNRSGAHTRIVIIAWIAAAVVIAAQLIFALGRPDAVSQTFDNGFHLNAVRFILDAGNASSFSITGVLGAQSFYPAAWHDLVSLVAATPGVSVPVAATVTNIAIAAIAWPGAVLLLVRVLLPRSGAALVIAAVFCASMPWFPLLMLTFGVLFPFFLAAVLLPLSLGLSFSVLGKGDTLDAPLFTRWFALVCVLGAMALAQPAVAFAAVAFAIPAFLSAVIEFSRGGSPRWNRILGGLAAVALVAIFAVLWIVVGRMGGNAPWGASAGVRLGTLETLFLFRNGQTPSYLIAIAVLVGLATILWRRKRLWLAGAWLVGAGMFFVAEVVSSATLRTVLLGLFYKDPPRLAALFAIVCLPVAVVGASWVWERAKTRFAARTNDGSASKPAFHVLAVALLLILTVGGQGIAMKAAVASAVANYSFDDPAPILSADELALIERMPDTTDPDGVVVGNPWTGTNLAYALADREVLNPHFNYSQDPDHVLINTSLAEAASEPAVCAAIDRLGIEYALDFGVYVRDAAGVLGIDATAGFTGLTGLATAPGFEEIDREGESVLYRVTACD